MDQARRGGGEFVVTVNMVAGRVASANNLQNALWWFEGELSSNPNNLFVAAATQAVLNGWTGLGDVRVLNLYFPNGAEAQDQLFLIEPPGV